VFVKRLEKKLLLFVIATSVVVFALIGCINQPNWLSWQYLDSVAITVGSDVESQSFRAGVAKIDATPPVGVPLAGFGSGRRRLPFPDLRENNYYTYLTPSGGVKDPIFVKALVLTDGQATTAVVTLDMIATDSDLVRLAYDKAVTMGVPVALDDILVCSSHTHSGPGALSSRRFWALLAGDIKRLEIADAFADKIAQALYNAFENLQPARFGAGVGQILSVTKNRRYQISPDITEESIDPQVGVIRIDRLDGSALAVLWNFAIHGTAWGDDNLQYSADIMGAACDYIEQDLSCVALFANAAEGDISPVYNGSEQQISEGAAIMAREVVDVHQQTETTDTVLVKSSSIRVDCGPAYIDMAVSHWDMSEQQDYYNPMHMLGMGPPCIENQFRFQVIRLNDTVLVSVPGEPIMQLGKQVKQDAYAMGFRNVFVFSLANGHMGYITTEEEYRYGGYEAVMTLWGPTQGSNIRETCRRQMQAVR